MKDKNVSIGLSDTEIIKGLQERDDRITRDYFYGYCHVAYYIYDKRYNLTTKPGMDFYSITHEYYLSLSSHNFKQLEDRKPSFSLKTWMVNGYRFVILDRLKKYEKEFNVQCLNGKEKIDSSGFDMPADEFQQEVRNTVDEICHDVLRRDSVDSIILQMIILDGFKGKEVSAQLGITPSAVTQRYHRVMESVVIPYFKSYFDIPLMSIGSSHAIEDSIRSCKMLPEKSCSKEASRHLPEEVAHKMDELLSRILEEKAYNMNETFNRENRVTPDNISSLGENEIFVFGSNLQGMHGGGAAHAAHLYFGAVMGQGVGLQGKSYAIPTMQGGVETIRPYVDQFIDFAREHPDMTFYVTRIGCGIAGFSDSEIAPLFKEAEFEENIFLPESFWELI